MAETPDTKGADMVEVAEELVRHGQPVPEDGWQHFSAIPWEHTGLTGDVSAGEHLLGGNLRPLPMQEP